MMRRTLIGWGIGLLAVCSCQTHVSLDITPHQYFNAQQEILDYYIGRVPGKPPADKLLVMIQGSGQESIRRRFGWGAEAAGWGYDVLYLEKFAYDQPERFAQTNCRQRRAQDIRNVVEHVIRVDYGGKLKSILLLADSEGGAFASELVLAIPQIRGVILVATGGMPQAQELEIMRRKGSDLLWQAGIYSERDLNLHLDEIRHHPRTDKTWLGHTFKRWASYLDFDDPAIRKLTIPILYFHGTRDDNSPVESGYALKEKMKGKNNFDFHVLDDLDHNFNDSKGNNHFRRIVKEIILPWHQQSFESKTQSATTHAVIQ